jgi:N-acetyl-gamma-glutamyl-phosphate reductase
MDKIAVAILGASGYTGAELIRILVGHPAVRIAALSADRKAGQPVAAVFPQFMGLKLPDLVALDKIAWDGIDAVFCALPHGTTQEVIAGLPERLKIVDLSADFRLRDLDEYARWYGHAHRAPALQKVAVYGLTEHNRAAIAKTRLVANPGCYPTSAALPLMPLLADKLIDPDEIVIDSKSGVTGAGRALKENILFSEVAEGMQAYGVGSHRHAPEIDQSLSEAAGRPVIASFTPHLIPINRGMESTIYVKLSGKATAEDLRASLAKKYADEPFVQVMPQGSIPETRFVRGSNLCQMSVTADRRPGRAILSSVIDNLTKGASGQAVQNLNAMYGLPETTGLMLPAMFP